MMEKLSNIITTCAEHAISRPDPRYRWKNPHWFIGKNVKRSFKVIGDPRMNVEHMWVKVDHVEGTTLHGRLDNEPICDVGLKSGDWTTVERWEIEAVL